MGWSYIRTFYWDSPQNFLSPHSRVRWSSKTVTIKCYFLDFFNFDQITIGILNSWNGFKTCQSWYLNLVFIGYQHNFHEIIEIDCILDKAMTWFIMHHFGAFCQCYCWFSICGILDFGFFFNTSTRFSSNWVGLIAEKFIWIKIFPIWNSFRGLLGPNRPTLHL